MDPAGATVTVDRSIFNALWIVVLALICLAIHEWAEIVGASDDHTDQRQK